MLSSPPTIRLNRYLAMCGVCSRRQADVLIASGEVKIGGKTVRTLGVQVNPLADEVRVRGEAVRPVNASFYVLLNKPPGYVTTAKDEKGRDTVFSLVRTPMRLFPVGRLDRDSEGLLLLTNDGELSYRLMHPRYKIAKVYRVVLQQKLEKSAIAAFRKGLKIDDEAPVTGELKLLNEYDPRFCAVTIWEGRNRQVRRMFAVLGHRVKSLQRTQFGPLALGHLRLGEWRYLSEKEVAQLRQATGLAHGNSQ